MRDYDLGPEDLDADYEGDRYRYGEDNEDTFDECGQCGCLLFGAKTPFCSAKCENEANSGEKEHGS